MYPDPKVPNMGNPYIYALLKRGISGLILIKNPNRKKNKKNMGARTLVRYTVPHVP